MGNTVALDIGGTKIEGVLFDAKLRPLRKIRRQTEAHKPRRVTLQNIMEVINALRGSAAYPIGIAMPGYPPKHFGGPNIPRLIGLDVQQLLRKRLGTSSVFVENDARLFTLAEAIMGAAKGKRNVVGVILGTGVGGGAIGDGKLLQGRDHAAAHIGHMVIDSGKTFEQWCSGHAISRRYVAAGGSRKESLPSQIWRSRDRVAKHIIAETYEKLGIGFANLVHIYNPEVIVVGGGLSNLPLYAQLKKAMKKHDRVGLQQNVRVVRHALGDSAGVYGAAILATQKGRLWRT